MESDGKEKKRKMAKSGKTWLKVIEEMGLRREKILGMKRGNWKNLIELDRGSLNPLPAKAKARKGIFPHFIRRYQI